MLGVVDGSAFSSQADGCEESWPRLVFGSRTLAAKFPDRFVKHRKADKREWIIYPPQAE